MDAMKERTLAKRDECVRIGDAETPDQVLQNLLADDRAQARVTAQEIADGLRWFCGDEISGVTPEQMAARVVRRALAADHAARGPAPTGD